LSGWLQWSPRWSADSWPEPLREESSGRGRSATLATRFPLVQDNGGSREGHITGGRLGVQGVQVPGLIKSRGQRAVGCSSKAPFYWSTTAGPPERVPFCITTAHRRSPTRSAGHLQCPASTALFCMATFLTVVGGCIISTTLDLVLGSRPASYLPRMRWNVFCPREVGLPGVRLYRVSCCGLLMASLVQAAANQAKVRALLGVAR